MNNLRAASAISSVPASLPTSLSSHFDIPVYPSNSHPVPYEKLRKLPIVTITDEVNWRKTQNCGYVSRSEYKLYRAQTIKRYERLMSKYSHLIVSLTEGQTHVIRQDFSARDEQTLVIPYSLGGRASNQNLAASNAIRKGMLLVLQTEMDLFFAEWFFTEVHPRLRDAPEVTLIDLGNLELTQTEFYQSHRDKKIGIAHKSDASDMETLLSRSKVLIASNFDEDKASMNLFSLSVGLPVISTTLFLITEEPSHFLPTSSTVHKQFPPGVFVEDTPIRFADRVEQLLSSHEHWEEASSSARNTVLQFYGKSRLESDIGSLLKRISAVRAIIEEQFEKGHPGT